MWIVGTGTEDIVNLCKDKGLKSPEYHQEEDFRVVIWRRGGQVVQSDLKVIQGDSEVILIDSYVIQIDSELEDAVYELIKEDHSISRAALAKALGTSECQVRKAIDVLRDKRIRRKGVDSGE